MEMKAQIITTTMPQVERRQMEFKDLRLTKYRGRKFLAAARAVISKTLSWLDDSYMEGSRTHKQVKEEQEKIFIKRMKSGFPPRVL
jgi:hypothetical protein